MIVTKVDVVEKVRNKVRYLRHTAITHEPRISRIPRDQEKLKKLLRLGQIPPNHAARKVLIDILGVFQK